MIQGLWQKKIGLLALVGGILAFNGLLFLVITASIIAPTVIFLPGTVSAQGIILSCVDNSDAGCQPAIRFQTSSGQQITFQTSMSSSTFVPQHSITVRYHPDDPQNAQIDPWALSEQFSPMFGIGLLILLVGLSLFLVAKNHPSADLIKRYSTC